MKQKAKRILVVMLTVMIIFGYLAPLVADEANAATADLDLCDLGCELEHCDGDHCDGGHYDEENCDWGHCDEEICDGVICDGDNCDGGCYSEHCGDCECENGHCDEQCDVISEEVSSSSSVGRRAKAEAVCNHVWKTEVSKQPGCTTAGVYVTRCIKCRAYAQNGNGYITPLGHKWTKRIVKQPTCTQQGEYETRCQRCNAISANGGGYLPALGHALSWRQVVAPTETSTGVEENKCNRCGYVAERRSLPPLGNGSTSSSVGRTVLVHPACAYNKHVWKTYTTKEPTCTTSGTYITKCSVCGAGSPNGNGYLPALGHKWNRTAPTCTQDKKCDRCGTVDKSRLGHSYAWRTKVNATCTANGTKEKYCTRSGCGYVAERQTIQALGHAWDNGTVTKAATCTATGVKTKKCTRSGCSATTTEEIPKAAHNCEWRVTVQASCKGAGTRQLTCKVCGTGTAWESIQYYGDHTWVAATCTKPKTCSVCGTTSGSKLDHAYAWRTTVNPTCTTVGKKEQYCTRPGCTSVVNRQDVAALNHAWDNGTVTKAATHSATGVKTFKCTRSGCGATKTESIPVIAHSYTWVVTTPSTCTKEGVESYKCSCGYVSQTRPVAKKPHNGVWATTVQPSCAGSGTEECTCKDCGAWLGARSIQYYGDHTWNRAAADCTHDKICTVCGLVDQKAPGHTYTSEATCTKDKKCDVCGYVAKKALGHNYQTVTTKQPTCTEQGVYVSKCTRCGDIAKDGNGYIGATGHKWKDNLEHADCERAKECTVCGFVAEEATGHKWTVLNSSVASSQASGSLGKSVGKGHVLGAVSEELFSEDQFFCEYCKIQADVTEIQARCHHDWVLEKTVDATCKSSGYKKYRCCRENCKDIIIKGIRPKKHLGEWEVVTPPTVNKIGTEGYRCDSCGDIVEERECYLVAYDANGGTDAPDSQIKYFDQDLTLAAGVPKWQGHTFRGWAEAPNATHPIVKPNGTYCANANLKLYAVWAINTNTIILNAIGATNIPSSVKKNYDEDLVLPTPVRSRYIFKGWSDAANGTVKFAPGAKYTENADAILYAIWEQYYVSASPSRVTVNANGNRTGNPITINLSSNLAENYHAWIKETVGGDDWLEVQVDGNTLKIWVDANLSGTGTRKAIISVSNDSEAGCTVEVQQRGNYLNLKDEEGRVLSDSQTQQIWFDESGKYNDNESPSFYVDTLIGSYTCFVEFDKTTSPFFSYSVQEDCIKIECQPNERNERAATLIVQSGSIIKRYRIVQQPKQILVTYQTSWGGQIQTESVKQDYGTCASRERTTIYLKDSLYADGVELKHIGWITDDKRIISFDEKLYKDTICIAAYSGITVAIPLNNTHSDIKKLVFSSEGKTRFGMNYIVKCYRYPQVDIDEYAFVNDYYLSVTRQIDCRQQKVTGGLGANLVDPNQQDYATEWLFELCCDEYVGEMVLNDRGEEVFAPYTQSREQTVVFSNKTGAKMSVPLCQEPPEVLRTGWSNVFCEYGVTEEEFFDVRNTSIPTNRDYCRIRLRHEVRKEKSGLYQYTDYRIDYIGKSAYTYVLYVNPNSSQVAQRGIVLGLDKEVVQGTIDWLQGTIGCLEEMGTDKNGILNVVVEGAELAGEQTGIKVLWENKSKAFALNRMTGGWLLKPFEDEVDAIRDIDALIKLMGIGQDMIESFVSNKEKKSAKIDVNLLKQIVSELRKVYNTTTSGCVDDDPYYNVNVSCRYLKVEPKTFMGKLIDLFTHNCEEASGWQTVSQEFFYTMDVSDWNRPWIITEITGDVREEGLETIFYIR